MALISEKKMLIAEINSDLETLNPNYKWFAWGWKMAVKKMLSYATQKQTKFYDNCKLVHRAYNNFCVLQFADEVPAKIIMKLTLVKTGDKKRMITEYPMWENSEDYQVDFSAQVFIDQMDDLAQGLYEGWNQIPHSEDYSPAESGGWHAAQSMSETPIDHTTKDSSEFITTEIIQLMKRRLTTLEQAYGLIHAP